MLILTPGEKIHGLAQRFYHHYEERLESARRDLERSVTEAETYKIRGRIVELRALLSLWDEDPQIPPTLPG